MTPPHPLLEAGRHTLLTTTKEARCMDTIDLDSIFPFLNILQSCLMKSHRDTLSPYHTNFLRNKASREIKAGYGIDHSLLFFLNICIKELQASVALSDSLISSHNCLILTCRDIWVHPLTNETPNAAIKHLLEFIFNIDELNERLKETINTFNDSFANLNEENATDRLNR